MNEIVLIINGVKYTCTPIEEIPTISVEVDSIAVLDSDTDSDTDTDTDMDTEVKYTEEDEDELTNLLIEEELKLDSQYYKMDTVLNKITTNNLEELKLYTSTIHPNIKISRSSTIPSLTDKLLTEAYQTASIKQLKDTMLRIRAILNSQTPNINHLCKRFQNLRKIIIGRFGKNSPISKLHYKQGGLTHEQFTEKELTSKLNRDNRLSNRTQISEKEVREILNKTSSSDDIYNNILAIQLATGARFIEAVRLSSFKRVPYSKNIVKIIGVAKGGEKGKIKELDRPIYGLDIDELLELQGEVRKQLKLMYPRIDSLSNDEVDKLLLHNVNRRVKDLGITGVESSHMLRKMFANITHLELPKVNKKAMDKHHHIRTVLGHKNIETSASYANLKVKKTNTKIPGLEDIEKKFDVVDKINDKQDAQIKELQTIPVNEPLRPKYGNIVTLVNLKGEEVEINDNIPLIRGNAKARCLNIMEQLSEFLVNITEVLLKKEFRIGSKIISGLISEKRALNAAMFATLEAVI